MITKIVMEKRINKAIELLNKIRPYVRDSSGVGVTTLVYVPPAQAMRNAADEMERKDALLREIDEFLTLIKDNYV